MDKQKELIAKMEIDEKPKTELVTTDVVEDFDDYDEDDGENAAAAAVVAAAATAITTGDPDESKKKTEEPPKKKQKKRSKSTDAAVAATTTTSAAKTAGRKKQKPGAGMLKSEYERLNRALDGLVRKRAQRTDANSEEAVTSVCGILLDNTIEFFEHMITDFDHKFGKYMA